jgi:hypothetical protein
MVAELVEALRDAERELQRMPTLDGAAFLAWRQAHQVLADWDAQGGGITDDALAAWEKGEPPAPLDPPAPSA